MMSNTERSIMPLINRAHKCNGLFHSSENASTGGIWMAFIFNRGTDFDRFLRSVDFENLGHATKLGDVDLSVKVLI